MNKKVWRLKIRPCRLSANDVANSATADCSRCFSELQKTFSRRRYRFPLPPIDNLGDYIQKGPAPFLTKSSVVNQQVDDLNDRFNSKVNVELQDQSLSFQQHISPSFAQGLSISRPGESAIRVILISAVYTELILRSTFVVSSTNTYCPTVSISLFNRRYDAYPPIPCRRLFLVAAHSSSSESNSSSSHPTKSIPSF